MSTTIILSAIGGIVPALFWLWFWRQEDRLHPEPKRLIFFSFIGGMGAVAVAFAGESYVQSFHFGKELELTLWASIEEIAKFAAAYFIVLHGKDYDEPIDALMYTISAALGFAALENSLFIAQELGHGNVVGGIALTNLRFIGATLLHTLASGVVGSAVAVTFYKGRFVKTCTAFLGLFGAIAIHTAFNILVLADQKSDHLFLIFGFVWACIIVLLVVFEKVKRLHAPSNIHSPLA